jgi:hypothetical protein
MAKPPRHQVLITVGVDTHAGTHVAAVVDNVGRVLGTESFAADAKGYGALVAWAASYGQVVQAGVEGAGSYGAGLKRHLAKVGIKVVEVALGRLKGPNTPSSTLTCTNAPDQAARRWPCRRAMTTFTRALRRASQVRLPPAPPTCCDKPLVLAPTRAHGASWRTHSYIDLRP